MSDMNNKTHKDRFGKVDNRKGWEKALIKIATFPAKTFGWLTGKRGGQVTLGLFAAYCALLSGESWYQAMPRTPLVEQENIRFIPKPFVNDGADIKLLDPTPMVHILWNSGVGVFEALLRMQLVTWKMQPFGNPNSVWLDWRFYIAIGLSAIVQLYQAQALRTLSIDDRKKKAESLSKYKKMDLDPKAIDIAQVATQEYNNSKMGQRKANGLMIATSYLLELGIGYWSLIQMSGVSMTAGIIYMLIQTFGFEIAFNKLREMQEEDERGDVKHTPSSVSSM